MIRDITLRLSPAQAGEDVLLLKELVRKSGLEYSDINDWRVIKRSIDARQRDIKINLVVRVAIGEDRVLTPVYERRDFPRLSDDAPRMIIVGAGPAGLFGALEAIRNGVKPIVIERGKDVDSRRMDIANISRSGEINPVSNYCFGEGGAGAYSDGKLYTRSKKRGSVEEVLQLLVQHGAHSDILVDAHPHIGSDRLPHVIKQIRETILRSGGEVHFETRVENLVIEEGEVIGVLTDKGEIYGDAVLLATGHSAHDTFKALDASGVLMEPKGVAIGVRLEHPQHLIDQLQYHSKEGRGKYLPAAEYSYVTQAGGRGVYSFCMCPGGIVVPAGSAGGELVVNGMSASARAGEKANSGMVVEIRPGDIPFYSQYGNLEILYLQEDLERRFFEDSGNSINAPAQRMEDFVRGRESGTLPWTTYAPGIHSANFHNLFPEFISKRLQEGFETFGRKCRGFLTNEAVMIGLESRTSSPVRLPRDRETMEHVELRGLYPVGEGAGYAGGIVSAAIDGINASASASKRIKIKKDKGV